MPPGLVRLGKIGSVLAVLGGIAFIGGAIMLKTPAGLFDEKLFWQAYFYGWLIWTSYAIGCFGLMLLQTVIRSNWGYPVMRLFEAGAKTLPIMFVLFLPILFRGAGFIYPWADPEMVKHSAVLQYRAGMMNVTWVGIRTLFYFSFWTFFTTILTRWSKLQDESGNEEYAQHRTNWAAAGMVLHVIIVTFAVLDWVMSLEPEWYSTMFGAWFIISQSMAAMSLVTLIGSRGYAADRAPWTKVLVTEVVRKDWGNMLLMLTMVWAYFSLSQWLIIWNGNLPQEIIFYVHRFQGFWLYVGAFIVIFQFFVPFLALLSGKTKRYPGLLSTVALWLMFMRFTDLTWHTLPIFHPQNPVTMILVGFAAAVAFGGLWFAMFVSFLSKSPLLPAAQFINGYREVKTHA
ncbi:MAG: quinol:cytochrome c oxidoreductase quinone-binding subunit 2 [Chthonomonadales bacterium]|nr:quinol:cytochrome c oxidoreductase quinone-binding subunit 2 [Chthonomonadales bacterium]